MQCVWRRRVCVSPVVVVISGCAALLGGCASPGPPRPPSLHLPAFVSDLAATRSGDAVELHFSVPAQTTDQQPIREATVSGSLCRQIGNGPCTPVDVAETGTPLRVPHGDSSRVKWTDMLPPALLGGSPRVVAYRVALRNGEGKTAGYSDPAFVAAGASPPAVSGLTAQGTRLGVALRWAPVAGAGEVLLQRTESHAGTVSSAVKPPADSSGPMHTKKRAVRAPQPQGVHRNDEAAGAVWLQAAPGDKSAAATLDGSVAEGVPYTYIAVRRETVQIGGRTLELRSAPSAPVTITWRDVYPPAAPQGLTALGYETPAANPGAPVGVAPAYAVDLVWQPVEDTRLAGYMVYRQALDASGQPLGSRTRLTPQPLPTPGFHDATAQPGVRYRYSVTAVDPKGNESAAAETVVESQSAQ